MKKCIFFFTAALLALMSCSNPDYELENLVPTQYHKVLAVKNSGKQSLTLSDTEKDDSVTITVMKLGSDPSLTANVSSRPLKDDELKEEYSDPEGVNYKQISADCYSFEKTELAFSSSDRWKYFKLAIHPKAVKTLMATDPSASWVLPLVIESKTDSVNANAKEYFLQLY